MGTLVVASAGADAQAQQVISQRDRTDKGVVFLWTGSRDAKPGLAQLKHARIPIFYTPDKFGPRPGRAASRYHTWRERRLVDGFATAPPRTAPQDAAIAQALASGVRHSPESESKVAVGSLGPWRVRREHRANLRRSRPGRRALGVPVALKSTRRIFSTRRSRGRSPEPRAMRHSATAYAEILGQCQSLCSNAAITGGRAGDGRRRCRSYHWVSATRNWGPGAGCSVVAA